MASDGIFPPDFKPDLSLKSMQGMIVNTMHNAGKNRGIDPKLVEEVEHELSILVQQFSDDVLAPMTTRGNIVQADLFKYYGIYREGLSIRKQIKFMDNKLEFSSTDVAKWIRVMKMPVAELMTEWSVAVLTVIYANLNLYYQRSAMRKRYTAFYSSENPLDWIDAMLANEEKEKASKEKSAEFDPPQEWIEISQRWSYMMYKRI